MTRRHSADDSARHSAHLRVLNLERVLGVVMKRQSPFTRAEVVRATGLSVPTVGTLTADLIRKGIIRDLGTGPSSGGRRPSFMEFNRRYGFVAGIDIGPTRTRLAVADMHDDVLARRIVPTITSGSPEETLRSIAVELRDLLHEAQVPIARLLAVGVGAPGMVDPKEGVVLLAPNLSGWVNVPIRDILQHELGAPVLPDNDVNLAVLGEHWRGAARGHNTCAFLFVGTGIGAGVLIDGAVHQGHHYMAGEVAVMSMGPQYLDRDFGSRGCLETLASLDALAARWPQARADPAGWIAALFEAADRGDPQARSAIAETAQFIGIAAATIGAVLDPSMIVLGGSMFAQADVLLRAVREVVQRIRGSRLPFQMVLSALGKDAPLTGSLLVASMEARRQVKAQLTAGARRSRSHPPSSTVRGVASTLA
jgi:predicted NBD/HSP70 family sugar kinase